MDSNRREEVTRSYFLSHYQSRRPIRHFYAVVNLFFTAQQLPFTVLFIFVKFANFAKLFSFEINFKKQK